ncbi:MAG: hydroxymethylbilane synthase [Bacteroidales bacterium]
MSKRIIKIGTRGSNLALYQAEQVREKIREHFPDTGTEIVIIKTKGDKILDVALSKIGDKGLFTKELERSLINGEVDMAVHSLKDLPTELPDSFRVGAVLERGDFRDALVSAGHKKISELNAGTVIGTSSLRRQAGLLNFNKDLRVVDIRGNVNTRLQKMKEGHCDAIVVAAAGLIRLGLRSQITEILDPDIFIPAVSQGIIAVETRKNDEYINEVCEKISHRQTWLAAGMERDFLNTLQGGCQVPAGCFTGFNGLSVTITGFIASPDGRIYIKEKMTFPSGEVDEPGRQLAGKLLARGGDKILKEIRKI